MSLTIPPDSLDFQEKTGWSHSTDCLEGIFVLCKRFEDIDNSMFGFLNRNKSGERKKNKWKPSLLQ